MQAKPNKELYDAVAALAALNGVTQEMVENLVFASARAFRAGASTALSGTEITEAIQGPFNGDAL